MYQKVKNIFEHKFALLKCTLYICRDKHLDAFVIGVADPGKQESLVSENVPDLMDAEQTWPTEEDIEHANAEVGTFLIMLKTYFEVALVLVIVYSHFCLVNTNKRSKF